MRHKLSAFDKKVCQVPHCYKPTAAHRIHDGEMIFVCGGHRMLSKGQIIDLFERATGLNTPSA